MYTYHTRHIDDRTTSLAEHDWSAGMNEIEGTLEVYIQYSVPLGLCHAQHQTIFGYTSIVYKNVDSAEIFLDLSHYSLSLCKVGSIASIGIALHSQGFYLLAGSLETSCHVVIQYKVCKGDISAFLSKFHCYSLTDTASGTCYQGCLST